MPFSMKAPYLAVEVFSALLAAAIAAAWWPSPVALLGAGVSGACLAFAFVIWKD